MGLWFALGGACAAGVGVALYSGFTVDDAFITARIAAHLSSGLGYRFNPHGPVVDAVTPLGWAQVLSVFARQSGSFAFATARVLGVISWVVAAGYLGHRLYREKASPWPLLLIALSAPLGAWSQSGMETGVVLALVTVSISESSGGLLAASVAAAMRPELIAFAFVRALARAKSSAQALGTVGATLLPALFVALLRWWIFGMPYPLSAAAKPPDLGPGLLYLVQTLLFAGPFWLWLGPGWKALTRADHWLTAAIVAHLSSVALVGGDWMVLLRLSVPILPAAFLLASKLVVHRTWVAHLLTWACAGAATAFLAWQTGWPGRHIVEQRRALIEEARPHLTSARKVGTLDIGWVGMAHAGAVFDFAGVTDPRIAHLPGGHTTKRIDAGLLRAERPDHLVLLLAPGASVLSPWESSHFARGVEARVAALSAERGCKARAELPLRGTRQAYVIVRCPEEP